MCGRVTLTLDKQIVLDILADLFDVTNKPALSDAPNYNIGPGQALLSVIDTKEGRRGGHLTWGFVPPWADDPKSYTSLINARSETVDTKKTFKASFESKRCIILADSFYEWKREKIKRPFRFQVRDQSLISFAGIYSTYTQSNGDKLHTCSILTCEPNTLMSSIHHRMPVILTPENSKLWLQKDAPLYDLKTLLKPYPSDLMSAYEVSSFVNSINNNSPECIHPIQEQQTLF